MTIGKVILIGAGAGEGGLISLRAERKVREADVIVTDRLLNPKILTGVDKAKIIYAGKHGVPENSSQNDTKIAMQDEINALLVKLAKENKIVARLKGGDPLIFGRGGEELEILARENIPFEIVPGITAASVAASFAGIPLTHRDYASTVCFVTGHENPDKKFSSIDYAAIAKMGTIVFYMSLVRINENTSALINAGLPKDTPSAIIERAGSGKQRTIKGEICELGNLAKQNNIKSPALIIIGSVVGLSDTLNWFENSPLFGKSIILTRPSERMAVIDQKLTDLGANSIVLPTIELSKIEQNDQSGKIDHEVKLLSQGHYEWIVLSSPKGAQVLADRLKKLKLDARSLANVKIAVIGNATGDKLRDFLIEPDLIPTIFTSQELSKLLIEQDIAGKNILLFRAKLADNQMYETLTSAGANVAQLAVYQTKFIETIEPITLECLETAAPVDMVVFGSSSTVRSFFALVDKYKLQDKIADAKMISIGPVTSKQLEEFGYQAIEAKEQSASGLVSIILQSI